MNAAISLRRISKTFPANGHAKLSVLENIDLEVAEGEFLLIVGPSGCGKSTLLRIITGLERQSAGEVVLGNELFHQDIGFVFQQFALLPWLTVYQNVELNLLAHAVPVGERRNAVEHELEHFGLLPFKNSYPRELSGGMRQRVGIARALVTKPRLLLMDEPFSELDSFTAETLRQDLLRVWQERHFTIVMVSHIVPEALELADRIVVLKSHPGRVEKIVSNKLPRPRQKRSKDFFKMEDELYALIGTVH